MPDLSKFMSDKGLLSSPSPVSDEEPEGGEEGEQSEMDSCVSDLADAVVSGDKDQIVASLHALIDCLKEEDVAQDQGE